MSIYANPVPLQSLSEKQLDFRAQTNLDAVQFGHRLLNVVNTPEAPASSDFLNRIERGLDLFDPDLLRLLDQAGVEVVTGRLLTDAFPEYAGQTRVNDEYGKTLDTLECVFRPSGMTEEGQQKGKISVFEYSKHPIRPKHPTPPLPPPEIKTPVVFDQDNPDHMKTVREKQTLSKLDTKNPERISLFHSKHDTNDNPFVINYHPNPIPVLRHETGHALSHSARLTTDLPKHSLSDDFIKAYLSDLDVMPDEVKPALTYYIQPTQGAECSEQGWEEAFAESFAATQGAGCLRQDVMKHFFKNTIDYVQGILASL